MAILDIFPSVPEGFEYLEYVIHSMFIIMAVKITIECIFDLLKSALKIR